MREGAGGPAPGPPWPRRRLRRRLGLERNVLRRPVDRAQRRIAVGLLVLLVAIAVPLASWAAAWAYDLGSRAERAERAERREVVATVVATGGTSSRDPYYVHETLQATWARPEPGPDGERTRTGTLPSWKDAEVGQTRRIWVDREGAPAVRPRPHSRTVTDAMYAAFAATLAAGAPVLLAYLLVRRRCDRHRDALWDAAWARMDADRGRNRPF
ncbi:hypothetical protein [Actinomadura sp. 21ATH]|uniref:Rv1733c family protein n=1 Tax=Actinomadura sp. 21ATH TaxID=1735444 RepID=UPI0035C265CB